MTYKILLPVTTPATLVKDQLEYLKGFEDHLIVINNWTDPETEEYVQEFANRGAECWDCKYNLGLAGSWNFGMKRMKEDGDDFVIFLSASAVFDGNIQTFIDAIQEHEATRPACRYIADSITALHCFAHTKRGLDIGGYFDENFWPIYYEDTDYCYRSPRNGVNNDSGDKEVVTLQIKDMVHSYGVSIACRENAELLNLYQTNAGRQVQYYAKKWGGGPGEEKFTTPFNNPQVGINEWRIDNIFNHPKFQNWNPPSPSKRYRSTL